MNLEDEPHRVKIGGWAGLSFKKKDRCGDTPKSGRENSAPPAGDGRSLWELMVVQSRRDRRVGIASLWLSSHH